MERGRLLALWLVVAALLGAAGAAMVISESGAVTCCAVTNPNKGFLSARKLSQRDINPNPPRPSPTGADIVPTMTSLTLPVPNVVSTAGTLTGGGTAWKMYDGDTTGSTALSFTSVTFPIDVIFDFGAGAVKYVASYRVKSGDTTNRYPTDWTLQLSADCSSYSTSDTQASVSWSGTLQTKTFTLGAVGGPFRCFKWHITNGQSSVMEIAEMQLIY